MTASAKQSRCILYHCIPERKDHVVQEIAFHHIFNINVSFVSKLLDKHVATQVRQHLEANYLFDVFQSAYHPAHSCETALVRIQDDILQSLDNIKSTIIISSTRSPAAFDTVDSTTKYF